MHTQGPFIMLWVFLKIILLIYLLLTVLGFFVAARFVCLFFSRCCERGLLFIAAFLIAMAPLVAGHRL